jgi:3',5'-cyclic AMP phosphodiesterase CpdA
LGNETKKHDLRGDTMQNTQVEIPSIFDDVLKSAAERISSAVTGNAMIFYLFSDVHYLWNKDEVWPLTAALMKELDKYVSADGIIGLGDYICGNAEHEKTKEQFFEFRSYLKGIGLPYFLVLGNHETNAYLTRDGKNCFSEIEKYAIYSRDIRDVVRDGCSLNYYKDFHELKMRFIFLKSDITYHSDGYLPGTLSWLEFDALKVPYGYSVLLFSHVPSRSDFDTSPRKLTGSKEYEHILRNSDVVAHIHGHTHIDVISCARDLPFKNISIPCAMCRGYGGMLRSPDQTSAVCFDAMVVLPEERKLKLIRVGAGRDREISF